MKDKEMYKEYETATLHQSNHLFWVLAQLIFLQREKEEVFRLKRNDFTDILDLFNKRPNIKRIKPWLLSDWISGFLFLPLVVSDCFFSGV